MSQTHAMILVIGYGVLLLPALVLGTVILNYIKELIHDWKDAAGSSHGVDGR